MSTQPLSSVLSQPASREPVLWGGLCCSTEAQSGEDASEEEEEEWRGRSKGEAGVTVGSIFSIMVESYWYWVPVRSSLYSVSSQLCAFFPLF